MRLVPWIVCSFAIAAAAGDPGPSPPVIVISVDTLRADHLSCYGYRSLSTPHIDAMARGGTFFSQAAAHVPLTLPSHASLLTSTLPFANGVRDNGQPVSPTLVTLASVLRSRGYRTGAFVGGFVLDRRFGLDRGFDTYDSPFAIEDNDETESGDLKRPAEEVVDSAVRWLRTNPSGPFFLFLHLFDLHTPYILPPDLRARFPGRDYDAALAYVDGALGHFWSFLESTGLARKALIVFLADHGESLGEHGERTHGYFVYQSTLHVPLILHWPQGAGAFPPRIDRPVGLIDVAPSILAFLKLAAPAQFQGRNLLDPTGRQVYSESLYASRHLGCAPLLSLRIGNYQYIEAPKPELYDLSHDPGEHSNLYPQQKAIAAPFARRLAGVRVRAPAPEAAPRPEVVQKLRSLGYLASAAPPSATPADPKDKIADYELSRRAIVLTLSGRLAESVPLFEKVLATSPAFLDARNILGLTQQKLGRNEDAVATFRQVLGRDPMNLTAHYQVAVSLTQLARLDQAVPELETSIAIASQAGRADAQVAVPARELLGRILLQKKDYPHARAQFEALLKLAPRNFAANYNLGWLATLEQRWEDGARYLRAAIESQPANSTAHDALGNLHLRHGELDLANAEFHESLRLNPRDAWAYYSLGLVLLRRNDPGAAAASFRKALECDAGFTDARTALERLGSSADGTSRP